MGQSDICIKDTCHYYTPGIQVIGHYDVDINDTSHNDTIFMTHDTSYCLTDIMT